MNRLQIVKKKKKTIEKVAIDFLVIILDLSYKDGCRFYIDW